VLQVDGVRAEIEAVKEFSQACENNKAPILAVLRTHLARSRSVLELGSGTGQHAVYFARHLAHLRWIPSDLLETHPSIRAWRAEACLPNLAEPLVLDVSRAPWPTDAVDSVFTANTLHIASWKTVQSMFDGIASVLSPNGLLCVYGPFNYGGRFTAPSNAAFDAWLRRRDPASGIRDFEAVDRLAADRGMKLVEDVGMPANNRTLVWRMAAES
jgi:SAM-dependent methyltransferase